MIQLHSMTDADFAWMLGEHARADGLILVEGGIAPAEVMTMLRGIAATLAADAPGPVAWLVSDDQLVIGMISFTKRGADGLYEIGYGVAPAHHGRGVMTQAIAALLPIAAGQGHQRLTAETGVDNPASQRVLERNGFVRTGTRDDPEDGALIAWAIDLTNEKAR